MPGLLVFPEVPASNTLVYEWVDPSGTVRALSANESVNVEVGERGLGVADVDLAEDKLPMYTGSVLRHASVQPIDMEIPLLLEASSGAALEALIDSVFEWFATATETSLTPGYLRVTRRDGTQRQRRSFYRGGLGGDLAQERAGETWQSVVVELHAPDATASDIEETAVSYDSGDLPSVTILNAGQLEAFPIWTFAGPLTSAVVTNETTEKAWTIGLTLLAGETLTVDTRPGALRTTPSVVDGDGTNRFSALLVTSDLWTLAPGTNEILLQLTGQTGSTAIDVTYLQRYRGLLR